MTLVQTFVHRMYMFRISKRIPQSNFCLCLHNNKKIRSRNKSVFSVEWHCSVNFFLVLFVSIWAFVQILQYAASLLPYLELKVSRKNCTFICFQRRFDKLTFFTLYARKTIVMWQNCKDLAEILIYVLYILYLFKCSC